MSKSGTVSAYERDMVKKAKKAGWEVEKRTGLGALQIVHTPSGATYCLPRTADNNGNRKKLEQVLQHPEKASQRAYCQAAGNAVNSRSAKGAPPG